MSRPLRIEFPGAWYHVMNRGRRRECIYRDDADHELFLKILNQTCNLFYIEIHAYVLMSNHYHLVIHTPKGNLSRAMRHINAVYTQSCNKKNKVDGSLFRGRYKSILIEEGQYLLDLVRYIHKNPIKAGLVKSLGEYKWCSYNGYLKKKEKENFLFTQYVLRQFGENQKTAIKNFVEFMKEDVSEELDKQLSKQRWPIILGTDHFKEEVKKLLKEKDIDQEEVPTIKKFYKEESTLGSKVERLLEKNAECLRRSRVKKYAKERKALVYLLRKTYGKSLREITKYMTGITYSGVSRMYSRAEKEIENKEGCWIKYEEMKKEIKC